MDEETKWQVDALKKLMEPFKANQISKLPKGTKAQNDCKPEDKVNCKVCGGWHHPRIKHLDYVGHAALTKRLLEVDPFWNWEPFAVNDIGEPRLDEFGGMWIWLTVCGVTRRGYGDAGGKRGPDANKERIGDAIRNAAMRFGGAIDLWIKEPPVINDSFADNRYKQSQKHQGNTSIDDRTQVEKWKEWVDNFTVSGATLDMFTEQWEKYLPAIQKLSKEHQAELMISHNEMIKYLQEMETKK
jgi:hypothetical protein